VAAAFLDRVQVQVSLPVVLLERGTAGFGEAPVEGVAVGDPRVGALVRLWRQADRDPVSLHAGLRLWIPVGGSDRNAGDPPVRAMPELIAAGNLLGWLRWA